MKSKHWGKGDDEGIRCLGLLQIMIRFAWNSYRAVAYLAADTPEDSQRSPANVLVIPTINRQLLDLLFSLAYMLDDFKKRSLEYQQAEWRELLDEERKLRTAFGPAQEWKAHFRNLRLVSEEMSKKFVISSEQQKNPESVPYWKTPFELKDEKSKCRPFLRHLERWLYRDTSAQAHLSFGGLFPIAMFLFPELPTDQHVKYMQNRALQQYRFQQISRTVLIYLAIATESDTYCRLRNSSSIDYLWAIFSEHVVEAKEIWDIRYAKRFN